MYPPWTGAGTNLLGRRSTRNTSAPYASGYVTVKGKYLHPGPKDSTALTKLSNRLRIFYPQSEDRAKSRDIRVTVSLAVVGTR